MANSKMNHPSKQTIFISYAHETIDHKRLVYGLASSLERDGFEVLIDIKPKSGIDWPLWMQKQLQTADYVLCDCTKEYLSRFDHESLPGSGLGVGWEGGLIRKLLYDKKLDNERIFPIYFSPEDYQYIPLPLNGYDRFPLTDDATYEQLLRKLTGQPVFSLATTPDDFFPVLLETEVVTPLFQRPIQAHEIPTGSTRGKEEKVHQLNIRPPVALFNEAQPAAKAHANFPLPLKSQQNPIATSDTKLRTSLSNNNNKNSEAVREESERQGKDAQLKITEFRKQERLPDAETIANIAIAPGGDLLAFSSDEELWLLALTDPFPKSLSTHPSLPVDPKVDVTAPNVRHAHVTKITAISFSTDGQYLVSGDSSGYLKICEIFGQKRIINLDPHSDVITSIVFSPRANRFCTASTDETLLIWDLASLLDGETDSQKKFDKKSKIKKRPRHEHDSEKIFAMAFSNDGEFVASGDQQGNVVVRELKSGSEVFRNKIHNHVVTSLAFSPVTSSLLATASVDSRIRLIDFNNPSNIRFVASFCG